MILLLSTNKRPLFWQFHILERFYCRISSRGSVSISVFFNSCEFLNRVDRQEFIKIWGFTAVTMKNGVFWDVTFLRSIRRLLVAPCVVPSSPILVTLKNEAPGSSETSVLTRATRRNIPEDTIRHECIAWISICMHFMYHLWVVNCFFVFNRRQN
jgi:hypothetical protein